MRFVVSRDRGRGTWTTSRPHLVVGKLMLTTMRVPAGTHPVIDGVTTRLHLQPPGAPRDPDAQEVARYGGLVVRVTPTLGVTAAWENAPVPHPIRTWSKLPTWLQPLLRPLVLRARR